VDWPGEGLPNLVPWHGASARFSSGSSKDRSGIGEDVSALRRLEARRATVSDSVYSLNRMREATLTNSGMAAKACAVNVEVPCGQGSYAVQ